MFKLPLALLCLMSFVACHPLSIFNPKALKTKPPVINIAPDEKIRITIDSMGLPYIKAKALHDAIYGLGFMHARDRLWQLDLLRHASQGRMGELFGDRVLNLDKKLRILTYRLDEQVQSLSAEENILLDHYLAGVNEGAKQRGRTAEHFFVGAQFEELSKRDVVAIARLQAWQLAADLHAEIFRLKLARSDLPVDAIKELVSAVDDRGSAIISGPSRFAELPNLPAYLDKAFTKSAYLAPPKDIMQMSGGASNAWVINGRLAKGGTAEIYNDPHLQHNWPSNFYLATIDADGFFATGASFVGLPGILVGATKKIAWGVTASYLNTQDTVLLETAKDKSFYVVDGKNLPYVPWPQRYCVNKKGKCKEIMHYVSIFGPVIDAQFDSMIEKDDRLAVQWTGFHSEEHKDACNSFLKLAQAPDVNAGVTAIKSMTLPGVNLVLADVSGNIGYAFAGLVPRRDPKQHPYLPLDGKLSASRWEGFRRNEEPTTQNPPAGYIITANQNIYASNAADLSFGTIGAPPYRALRIKERIESMIKDNALIDFDSLSQVQLDDTSTEAKELAPLVGALCVEEFREKDGYRQSFARAIANFDGRYTKDSKEALPYEMLMQEMVNNQLKIALKKDNIDLYFHAYHLQYTIKNALLKGFKGEKTALFADDSPNSDVKTFVRRACEPGYLSLVKRASKNQWAWRWGKHHFLQLESPLAKAPLIGGFFRDKKREVAGTQNAPMAEGGLPVRWGANLRFRAKLTDPPEVYAVIDAGNSGTVGHKNAFDQALLWHEGKSLRMETDWSLAIKTSSKYCELERTPSAKK
jgi:penicillin G amidase